MSSHFKKNWKIRMSSMNEQDFESNYGTLNTTGSINIPNISNNKSNIGSPSSPSSLSSSSSTSSSSCISSSNQQATAAAVQAAMQALLQNNSTSSSLLTSTSVNQAKSLLTPKELAKLNLDVKNFKLQDTLASMPSQQLNLNNLLAAAAAATNSNSPNSLSLQQQLLMQSQNLDQTAMLNLLNGANLNTKNNQQTKPSSNSKSNRQSNGKPSQQQQQPAQPQSNQRRFEQSFDDDESVAAAAAAMMAAATSGANPALNLNLINKHNQRNIRRDLIKGNSMSPSPPGTSCSDETETQSGHSPLSSSMLIKNEPHYNGLGSISSNASASSSSVDDNHSLASSRRRSKGQRPKNKSMDNNDELIENDCDENDDIDSRSSPRSLSITHNDNELAHTNQDYDSSILNENADEDQQHTGNYDDENDGYDTENLDDEDESGFSQKSPAKKNKLDSDSQIRNRNNSTSSPTRSSSSTPQSRSISPSNSYHDSPAAFPNLAAVAAANGIDSTTAMLAAQSLLQQQTPGISFPNLAAAGLGLNRNSANAANAGASNSAATRKRRNEREQMNERIKKIKPVPDDKKDEAYWERRRKNNEAAKRSRDLRRQKEDEIAERASFLEQENLKLKAQVTILKAELSKLHFMLYNR